MYLTRVFPKLHPDKGMECIVIETLPKRFFFVTDVVVESDTLHFLTSTSDHLSVDRDLTGRIGVKLTENPELFDGLKEIKANDEKTVEYYLVAETAEAKHHLLALQNYGIPFELASFRVSYRDVNYYLKTSNLIASPFSITDKDQIKYEIPALDSIPLKERGQLLYSYCMGGNEYGMFFGKNKSKMAFLIKADSLSCSCAVQSVPKTEYILLTRVVVENGEVKQLNITPVVATPLSMVGSIGICLTFFKNHEVNGNCEALGKLDLLATFDKTYELSNYVPIVKLHLVFDNPGYASLEAINRFLINYQTDKSKPFLITYTEGKGAPSKSFTFGSKVLVEPALLRADSFEISKRSNKAVRIKLGTQLFVSADHYGLFNKDGVVSEQLIEKDCKECIENLMKPASGDRTPPTLLNLTPSISGKVLTQDVITGFEAYEDLGIGVNRRPCLKLTLKIEKRVGTPSLRQSNLFITTAKAKSYGPVFIVDEEIALSLSEALQEFYKRSTTNKPVFGFTDVCTDDLSKPVNTPLGKLFEAQLTFKGDDAQRQAKFFDFGVKDLEA